MFKKLKTSFALVKVSFKYIKKDGELFLYSIFSILSSFIILLTFIWIDILFVGFFDSIYNETAIVSDYIAYIYMFLFYFIFSFITFFFNTAIITSVQRRNEWKDNKLWDGLKDAMKHLKQIIIWSAINALVTTILKILQNKFWENSIIWKIIIWIVWGMWNILTFFSFPLMIINKMWPKEAIKESWKLFKKTWWERAIINVWVGLLFFLLIVLAIVLSIFIIYSWFIITWIIIGVLSIIFISILSSTCDVIIKTILLHYATHWELPTWLENEKAITELAWEKL